MNLTPRAGTESLPLSVAQHVEQVCDRFEAAWVSGPRPTIEDFLDDTPQSARLALLRELLRVEINYRVRAGEQPTPEEYQVRFPAFGEEIDTLFREARLPARAPEKAAGGKETIPDAQQTGLYVSQGLPAPKAPARLPAIPGYEIVGVLGQGGMGIVYEARHIKLNRPVALKMIRGADQVSEETLGRFLREAKAVAHLQHPNIVQIHEIGEHDGLPYFSLEYVDGGSLNTQIKGQPQPPQAAAALVETLARAMNYAHQRQIVHRDLKPANILLASGGREPPDASKPSGGSRPPLGEYVPKITDFGLAKQLDADLGHTQANAVMGTPSYMAPEQASGKTGESGPLADVYALGAILYELLIGWPPFKGATVLETLEQVRTQELVPPSKLQPKVPRDLETICLKCLAKDPRRRYTSAEALAEDLRRFLADESIQARPVGWAERAWKWVQRRPAWAALVGLTFLVGLLVFAVILMRERAEQVQDQSARTSKITLLTTDLEAGLQLPSWTPSHLAEMDTHLAKLDRLDPPRGRLFRQRLSERLAEGIRDSFSIGKKPVFRREDVPPVEAMLKLLESRDRRLADPIRKELLRRLRAPQLAVDLQFPFEKAKRLFPAQRTEATRQGLSLRWTTQPHEPAMLSEVACSRNAEMEVVFHHDRWDFSGPIGLILNAGKDQGYSFLLRVADFTEITEKEDRPAGKVRSLTFADAIERQGSVRLQIYRNQQRLREATVPIAELWPKGIEGPIRLKAARTESHLRLVCNNVTVDFDDVLPLPAKQDGVFGLYLATPAVRLQSLRAWIVNMAKEPSRLERGDELYGQGLFHDAHVEFYLQAQISADGKDRQEAEYKAALCLLMDKDADKAIPLLENVVKDGTDERWNMLASCQLWALRIEQGKKVEADVMFQSLRARYQDQINDLNLHVPDYLRERILSYVRVYLRSGLVSLLENPGFLADYERASAIEDFFQTPAEYRHFARFYLFRAYGKARQFDKALQTAQALFKEVPAPTPQNRSWWHTLWEEYALLMRVQDQTELALKEVNRDLFVKPGTYRPYCQPLLIERANLLASQERWQEAERDLDEFFRQVKLGEYPGRVWTRACLMRGFLRQRQGDKEGALAAWKLGLPKNHPSLAWTIDRTSPMTLGHLLMLCSLSEDFPDSEMELLNTRLFNELGEVVSGSGLKAGLRLVLPELAPKTTGPVLREMWHTQEGQRLAQQVAFRERPMAELYRSFAVFGAVRLAHRVMEPYRLTNEEDALLRQTANDAYTSGITRKYSKQQLMAMTPLVFSWRNLPSLPPFDTTTRSLEPSLRASLAYVFGLRYRHTYGNEREAAAYFKRALKAAPPESPLHRLAQAQLDRPTGRHLPIVATRTVLLLASPLRDGLFPATAILCLEHSRGK